MKTNNIALYTIAAVVLGFLLFRKTSKCACTVG